MVTNPYAVKKIIPTNSLSDTATRNDSNGTTTAAATVTASATVSAVPEFVVPKYTTFSQAFMMNVTEEGDHDDDTINTAAVTGTMQITTTTANTKNLEHSRDQHPNAATESHTNTAESSFAFRNDRDYHVLQQQPHVLYVSTKQEGNPILQYVRNVPFSYTRMVPDYIFSSTSCAIYLSCKYHILYRNYIYTRIAAMKTDFTHRILLLYIDMDDTDKIVHELNILCVKHNFTLLLGWSEMEMARYIETFKALQHRDATTIQRGGKDRAHMTVVDQMVDTLIGTGTGSSNTKLNKTDAAALITQFHTMKHIFHATSDELSMISGLGPVKVQRIYDTFHKPFSSKLYRQRRQQQQKTTDNELSIINDNSNDQEQTEN